SFIPHPFKTGAGEKLYRTGDLVRYLPNGILEFIGREDDQVKIRGFRIEMGEIESVLQEYKEVLDVIVSVQKDSTGDKKIVAYVIMDGDLEVQDIRQFAESRLPKYMVPNS